MTNIFSSKALKAENETLKASVTDLTAKTNDFNSVIETMKTEFNKKVTELEAKISELIITKAVIEQTAKAEVAQAKEEVAAIVNQAVVAKVAAIGITEADLPKTANVESVVTPVEVTPKDILEKYKNDLTGFLKEAKIPLEKWEATFGKA